VRFSVDQRIAGPCDEVEAAFVDPAFYEELGQMPKIGRPEILERREADGTVRLRVRYAFTGDLAAPARAVLDPGKMTWVVESTVDRARHRTEFRMVPDHYGKRLECHGSYVLEPDGADATVQHFQGELLVRYPVVGSLAERGIVTGLKEHLADEAAILERWLAQRRH
jgi:uncharacterized protein DUF2505